VAEGSGEHSEKGGEVVCRLEEAGSDGEAVGPVDLAWGGEGGLGSDMDSVRDGGMALGGGCPTGLGRTVPMPGLGPDTV